MRLTFPLLILTTALAGCKPGFNETYSDATTNGKNNPPCNPAPVDSAANAQAKKVLRLVATFSCEDKAQFNRVLAGQHLGSADAVLNQNAYNQLFDGFSRSGTTPAVLSVDYGGDQTYSQSQLITLNSTLKNHWNKNGLVSIRWMPKNPWETGFTTAYSNSVSLKKLTQDSQSTDYKNWRSQLDDIAAALKDLQDHNVAVLWQPFPLMNSPSVWWGSQASTGEGKETDFETLWQDTYNYLRNTKGLHNLIWVFAPGDTTLEAGNKPINWGLLESHVDILAPVVRNDSLSLRDYDDMINTNKPLALSELSPSYTSSAGGNSQQFDTLQYKTKLTDTYPFIAYWISWHNPTLGDKVHYLALTSNKNAASLLQNNSVITTEKITRDQLFTFSN